MLTPKKRRFDSALTKAVLKVGEGRGFIIQHRVWLPPLKSKRSVFNVGNIDGKSTRIVVGPINEKRPYLDRRLVVTAAHCLPFLPPAHVASYVEDRTYMNLLGVLGAEKPNVWAECLFADPVADVAVLGMPDDQELSEQAEAYEALTEGVPAFRVAKPPREGRAWVLTLDGKWVRLTVGLAGYGLQIDATKEIKGGMSGSPILSAHGTAIGIVCTSGETKGSDGILRPIKSLPNPVLAHHLPGWLLRSHLQRR